MYLTGGAISFVAFLVFAFMVHPLDEPRGLRMQCTRKWFHWKYDSERYALGDQLAREKYCNERDVALAARKSSSKGSEAPLGARLCDALWFEKPRMRSVHVGSPALQ